jgi:hypothetical protein
MSILDQILRRPARPGPASPATPGPPASWPSPCSAVARPPVPAVQQAPVNLFAEASDPVTPPIPCGSRFFWEDPYGRRRCAVCSPPPSNSMVCRLWYVEGGPAASPATTENRPAAFVAVEVPTKSRPGPAVPVEGQGGAFPVDSGDSPASGDPAVRPAPSSRQSILRSRCQQRSDEDLLAWWDRTADFTDGWFRLLDATVSGRISRKPPAAPAAPPLVPRGKEPVYLVHVSGAFRVVEGEKAAAKFKARTAVTWAGAGRWWPLAGGEDGGQAAAGGVMDGGGDAAGDPPQLDFENLSDSD